MGQTSCDGARYHPDFYLLSFGPACMLVSRDVLPLVGTAEFYRPLVRAANSDFQPVSAPLCWYAETFAPETCVDFMALALTVRDDVKGE